MSSSPLKFGLLVTPVYGTEVPAARQIAEHLEAAETASGYGFELLACGQHFLGPELRYFQPVPYLTYLATKLPDMSVATGIMLLSMVSPVELAEQISTLDVLTNGRCYFGVGLGYSDREFRALGADPGDKIQRFVKGLELIKALWSGEPATSITPWWEVSDAVPAVRPQQRPGPPIWIGGQTRPAVRRAARMGDAWYAAPFPSHDSLVELSDFFRSERDRLGLEPPATFPVRRELLISDSREHALEQAIERSTLRYSTYRKWGLSANADLALAERPTAEDIETHFILGTPDDCAEQLATLRDRIGMTHFIFKAHWQGLPHDEAMQQIHLFGSEVVPRLR